jgi:hypothetical protein
MTDSITKSAAASEDREELLKDHICRLTAELTMLWNILSGDGYRIRALRNAGAGWGQVLYCAAVPLRHVTVVVTIAFVVGLIVGTQWG